MAKNVMTLAKAVASLSPTDYVNFRTWTAFLKGLSAGFEKSGKAPKKAKRKYTRRAPAAVEVAPGVSVKKRSKGSEIDHSPKGAGEFGGRGEA